ncbi:MAG: hypothetical protein UV80_C0001G0006 [Candidatus Peregrinibacteria bacterium GW2011_GWF2_43_17]|nr:MAG: hypothetical protein UV80_C0001G0006 [Candidatus Peregrinibacteria bacterium GW2011_GWF2_43_17]KKT20397.1 MAG: hypothetical protein UW03_C0005G0032 [Candidatus Peregrinibacteria bacterium GW2011_GWA2_43_8]HAU40249.1 hypothetical protein [Candidatus Peregrinibacteria bacterium]
MTNLYYKNKAKKITDNRSQLLSEEVKSTYYLLVGVIGFLLLSTTLTYLYISSQKSAKGYLLDKLQTTYEDLTTESKELDAELLDATSLTNIDMSETVTKMEKPGNSD